MKKQVYQRWMWVFIYLLFNEVFEELCMAVTGHSSIKHKAVKPRGAVAGSCGLIAAILWHGSGRQAVCCRGMAGQ
jgi:hypothetical protein